MVVTPPHKPLVCPAIIPGVAGAVAAIKTSVLDIENPHELVTVQV